MWEIIEAAGWPIWPLIATSIYGFAIILERAWSLRSEKVMPSNLVDSVNQMIKQRSFKVENLDTLKGSSPFGEIIYSALKNKNASLEVLKDSIEESSGLVAHKLETNINALGTISTVAPLLGLFLEWWSYLAPSHQVVMMLQYLLGVFLLLYITPLEELWLLFQQ